MAQKKAKKQPAKKARSTVKKAAPARRPAAAPKSAAPKSAAAKKASKSKGKAKPAARAKAPEAASPVRATPETLRLRSASPSFTVNDVEKSLAWYRDVLGCVVEERWEEGGKLMGVMLVAGSVQLFLGQDDWKKGTDRQKGVGFRTYCSTAQDVDVLAREIQARGGVLDDGPKDTPWGTRDFSFTDPDGFKFTIATEPKPKE